MGILSGIALLGPTTCSPVTTDGAVTDMGAQSTRREARTTDEGLGREVASGGSVPIPHGHRARDHHDKRR